MRDHIQQTIDSLKDDGLNTMLGVEDQLWIEIIDGGTNEVIDTVCEGLQFIIRHDGGLVSTYCNAGSTQGMELTRAAFAIMVKQSGLYTVF